MQYHKDGYLVIHLTPKNKFYFETEDKHQKYT